MSETESAAVPQLEGALIHRGTLTLLKREGHCRLLMQFSADPEDTEGNQSAGAELEDALKRAHSLWEFTVTKTLRKDENSRVYNVAFTKN
jgi:hypothetical protein